MGFSGHFLDALGEVLYCEIGKEMIVKDGFAESWLRVILQES